MLDMTLGAGSPMWTAMPALGSPYQAVSSPYQPIGLGARSMATPVFNSPMMTAGIGGAATSNSQQTLAGPGLALAYPFANLLAAQIGDAPGVVTASSILAAVAMRRGQPQGPTTDAEVEEFIYDALDLLPGAADVEIRCESGRVTITGTVQQKRTKRDVGEIAWAIPGLHDVQNNVSITSRRRARGAGRDAEAPTTVSSRKPG